MAIDAYGSYTTGTAYSGSSTNSAATDKSKLSKDDFMKLLLLELQYQDPTSPMDTEKILSQTSQLATLESSDNTKNALEKLAASLTSSMQFSGIAAIGKIADTGSNAIVLDEGKNPTFELYFPQNVQSGNVNILDVNGNVLRTMQIGATNAGIASYTWDGKDNNGKVLDAGTYYVESKYTTTAGDSRTTRLGLYPIESVKFENGTAYAKLGSSYVDFTKISEVSNN